MSRPRGGFLPSMQIVHEHEQRETIVIDRFYPDHPPRTESALFRRTKHHLVHVLDTPCYVCGTKEGREVHHFHAEWADANGIDWKKMRRLHPAFDWSSYREPSDFIDSEYNMMVLCEKHHRGKDHGIHLLPFPLWQMQVNKRADFVFSPDEAPTIH
ncbi:TPA: hypothetical protein ACU967_002221 [Burkholderia contaminans]|uniref:hypothetical protein n=1 Tax=Burkholderia contaminans TaxID=488447 RepID=UPI0011B206F0|nr:hypothetical protein [Burkholderia contaminans]MBM6427903.1 hypothetical protein [Burkholderia contaminans]MCA7876734.1 hypothetical protein [Burkholderia contaminans]MDN8024243.1 hypothetical protein [Burkholderia contaminans]HDR9065464.1 hypothetical protein [Burkholderia vietnamiensis]